MSKKLTPWFPEHIKPVREGVYFVEIMDSRGYAYWTGRAWGWLACTEEAAFSPSYMSPIEAAQHKKWRGLAEQPK